MPLGSDGKADGGADAGRGDIASKILEESAFTVSTTAVRFTASTTLPVKVTIRNETSAPRRLVARKVSHLEFKDGIANIIKENPLFWVPIGFGKLDKVQETNPIDVPNDGSEVVFWIGDPKNASLQHWAGTIELVDADGVMPKHTIDLDYAASPEGQWSGRAFYFGNFGTRSLEAWRADRNDDAKLQAVGNAFVRRWGAFRNKRISWDEMKAVLTATQSGSWRWPSVKARCPNEHDPNANVGCYLYDNGTGMGIYSDFLPDAPIPSGVSELPVVMNVHAADPKGAPGTWIGKLDSSQSLPYAGSPQVSLEFESDPNVCAPTTGGPCTTLIRKLHFDVLVGGRYWPNPGQESCTGNGDGAFVPVDTPWLIAGFTANTAMTSDKRRVIHECRQSLLPFGSDPAMKGTNVSFAASNPVPDGTVRRRQIDLIDGAMIDQEQMVVLFSESFPSFLDPADPVGFSAYGYMVLSRSAKDLAPADYKGSTPRVPQAVDAIRAPACKASVLSPLGETAVTPSNASALAIGLIEGLKPTPSAPPPLSGDEVAHYYCEDTNLFDGGEFDDGSFRAPSTSGAAPPAQASASTPRPCPPGSRVRFFTLKGPGASQSAVASLACQKETCATGTGALCGCGKVLDEWLKDPGKAGWIRPDPLWRCKDSNETFCESDRFDLRRAKTFYGAVPGQTSAYAPLDAEIDQAFRYKTKFQSRTGTSLGFAPSLCLPGSSRVPYCYDPPAIEEIRDRIDCLQDIYVNQNASLATVNGKDARALAKNFLTRDYATSTEMPPGASNPIVHVGFEGLNAELLVMLGDDAYTAAFASRFDLANQNLADFQGSKFEPSGIDLAGEAGFQMYRLYQAIQYYQMALDRFYGTSPTMWASLGGKLKEGQGFITPATVVTYFDRLIRASAQKTRAANEIARSYLGFNRPDLARRVIERSYTSAHLESIILERMMQRVSDASSVAAVAQIAQKIEETKRIYGAALLDMWTAYKTITDSPTYFGFPEDYVPMPIIGPTDTNAVTKTLQSARELLERAKEKELLAIQDNRSFETDSAQFQAELANVTRDYETRLAGICGTFVSDAPGGAAAVYPAIPKYAELHSRAKKLGDPCGLMGNGALADAMGQLEMTQTDFQKTKLNYANTLGEIRDEAERVTAQCARIDALKDFTRTERGKILTFNDDIRAMQVTVGVTQRALDTVRTMAGFWKCMTSAVGTDCPQGLTASLTYGVAAGVAEAAMAGLDGAVAGLQHRVDSIETDVTLRNIGEECTSAQIDMKYRVRDLWRKVSEIELDAVREQYAVKLALSNIQKDRNEALMLMQQVGESQELLINVEAARNDPNVRIYRNDTILSADWTFRLAVREAYRATKVFEYFTSQSYAGRDKLFLVRMVSHGDYPLERYLAELQESITTFQEQYGAPETRVAVISLMDDIFQIPRLDKDVADSTGERREKLRKRITSTSLLDDHGYLTMPFSTSLEKLSPLTRNHRLLYVEAEIDGDDTGDALGRIYLRQRGTGTVRALSDDKAFFSFPLHQAVINTFFNGHKSDLLSPDIYKSDSFRDRPFANTAWELVFNRKDERENQDIRLDLINDIRLYVYYTDITVQ
jgi:hypothetical protein